MELQLFLSLLTILTIIYFICKQYYLNNSQFLLLISSLLMFTSLLLPQYITYVSYLILMSWQAVLILTSAKQTYYFDMKRSSMHHSRVVEMFFRVNQEEIFLIFYAILGWIWIRIWALKSLDYLVQGKSTFLEYLNGWNCTLAQFWVINLICTILSIVSLFSCHFILKYQKDKNHLYKTYLLNYKIYYDILISITITIYNYIAYNNTNKLSQCLQYYNFGQYIRIIWFWGYPLTTLLFIYKKHGVFLVQSHSEKAEQQNNLDQQLNHNQIEREYSQKSKTFSVRDQPI